MPSLSCLIIAMPKSASSSLTGHFMRHHGFVEKTQDFRDRATPTFKPAPAFVHMSLHNEGLFEMTDKTMRELMKSDGVVKYHFPPTPNNQRLLADTKKIILLREPEGVVRAWMRGDETRAYKLRSPEFAFTFSESAWLKRARDLGLLDELAHFADGWRRHQGEALIVEMRDLLDNPGEVLAKIETYLELPLSGATSLPERKFSRGRRAERTLWNTRARQIVRRRNVMLKRLAMMVRAMMFSPGPRGGA